MRGRQSTPVDCGAIPPGFKEVKGQMRRLGNNFILLFGLFWLSTVSAVAQSVTIQSIDGSISMVGELIGFDGETYIGQSKAG